MQYKKKEKEYKERVKELDEVTESRDNERKIYEGLRKKRLLQHFIETVYHVESI